MSQNKRKLDKNQETKKKDHPIWSHFYSIRSNPNKIYCRECEKSNKENPATYVSNTSVTNLKKHFMNKHNEKWKEIDRQYQTSSSKKSRVSVNNKETLDVPPDYTELPTNMGSPSRSENMESSSVSNMSIFDSEIKKFTIKNIKNIKKINIKGISQKNFKEIYLETEDEIEVERNNNVRFLNVPVEKEINKYTVRNIKKVIIDDIVYECIDTDEMYLDIDGVIEIKPCK
ncbi:20714_t:CDS:1 [Gigaspora margarita]|uniref:20714_t:CDS:1 n=1 Tax=Gigaspora margarita TaxID=4874 RepID=A0ABN7VNP4_GIGMA|nr:20714_t:CDS:1 [Gigaspora margarita]